MKLSIGAAALMLLALAPVSAQTIINTSLDATVTRAWEDSNYDTAFSTIANPNGGGLQAGNDTDAASNSRPAEWRSIVKFDISGLSGTVGTSTINLAFNTTVGNPNDVFVTTIDDDDNSFSSDIDGNSGFTEFDAAALNSGVLAIADTDSPSGGNTISLDVTSMLQADVDANRTYSTFRFYENPLNTSNANSHVRIFYSENSTAGASFDPYLSVIPEPSSGAFLFGLGACAFMFARRRVK